MSANAVVEQTGAQESQLPEGRYRAFDDPIQDTLFKLILSLGAEVWVLKDRLALLEEALSNRGTDVSELIEELSQNPDRMAGVRAERATFLGRFLRGIELAADR